VNNNSGLIGVWMSDGSRFERLRDESYEDWRKACQNMVSSDVQASYILLESGLLHLKFLLQTLFLANGAGLVALPAYVITNIELNENKMQNLEYSAIAFFSGLILIFISLISNFILLLFGSRVRVLTLHDEITHAKEYYSLWARILNKIKKQVPDAIELYDILEEETETFQSDNIGRFNTERKKILMHMKIYGIIWLSSVILSFVCFLVGVVYGLMLL
jgi:hypothetical protein